MAIILISHIGHSVAVSPAMAAKLWCLFVLLVVPVAAQVAQFENKRIAEIQFVPVQPLDPADLARALPFQKGGLLHADDVASAIDNLFASGRFEDIVVQAEPSGDGMVVRFVTQLTSFFGGLKVEGQIPHPPNRTQIASVTELTLGAPFRDEDLSKARDAVQDAFDQERHVPIHGDADPDSGRLSAAGIPYPPNRGQETRAIRHAGD